MKELRKYSRLPLERHAAIILPDGQKISGITKNISFGGLFLFLADIHLVAIGRQYTLILLLESSDPPLEIEFQAEPVHKTSMGIGLKLLKIELDHYEHFKNLMVHNTPDPAILLEELEAHPGLLITSK